MRRARRQGTRGGTSVFLARAALAVVLALAATACAAPGDEVAFETRVAHRTVDAASTGPTTTVPVQSGGLLPSAAGTRADAAGGTGPVSTAPREAGGGASGVVKLGTVLPLQGGQRDWGEPVLRTTQAFIDEVNARGGVNGRTLQLVAYNACLTCLDDSLQAVRRLVEQDGVFALVNTYPMVMAFPPVIPYLAEHGVPLIQGAAESQTSDALSPVNFTTAVPGVFYGRFLPRLVTEWAKVRRIGLAYLDVPSEAEGIDELEAELAQEGVEVVAKESIAAAEDAVTNMDSLVTRMRLAGAEGMLVTNPVLVVYGRLAADRQGWDAPWVGPAAWSRLVENTCGSVCDDVVFTESAGLSWVGRDTPQMHQYLDTMARRYPGGELTGHTLAAWVGMQLTTEILSRTGPDRQAFIAALDGSHALDLGTTAPLRFGPDRHMGGTATVVLKLRGGHYEAASEPLSYGEIQP